MKIVGIGEKVMHFVHVEAEGEVHEIPIDKTTYTLFKALSVGPAGSAPAPKKVVGEDDWMGHLVNQEVDEGGNGAPQPLNTMPPDLASKLAAVGIGEPPEADIHREEEQDPGEVFQDAESDEGEEAASL